MGLEERLPVLVQARLPECRHERETLLIDFLFEPDKVDSLPIMGQSPMKLLHERYKASPSAVSNDELALLYACLCTASFQQAMTRLGDDGFRHMMDKDPNEPREDVAYFDRAMKLLSVQYPASISSCCECEKVDLADGRGPPDPSRLDCVLLWTGRVTPAPSTADGPRRRDGIALAVLRFLLRLGRSCPAAFLRVLLQQHVSGFRTALAEYPDSMRDYAMRLPCSTCPPLTWT